MQQQPETRSQWLKRRNQPDLRVVYRNSKGFRDPPARPVSIEIGQDALRVQELEAIRQSQMIECALCCELVPPISFRVLTNCQHFYCSICVRKYITQCILENRIEVPCPGCSENIHPDDIKIFINQKPDLVSKYEEFSVRAALVKLPDARWCPAPDCGFAVIVPNGEQCPKIKCQKPKCKTEFCFKCKKVWHEGKPCHTVDKSKTTSASNGPFSCRPCPRCQTLIMKENDGSCNHMHCTMCKAEFCWLCLKQITDLHYMSPTGCTFWGKKTWSGKKRLIWQLGSLIGTPAFLVATAVVSVPLIIGLVPYSIGRKVYKKMKNESKAKRVISTAAAVTGSAIVSPAIAGVAVVIGVPLALGYTYVMVPKALIIDVADYMQKKKRPEVVDISPEELLEIQIEAEKPPHQKAPEYLNVDGSAPGPSSASSSVSSSDYSEDFDSADYLIELCDETSN